MGPGPVLGPHYISLKPEKARAWCREKPAGLLESPTGLELLNDEKLALISTIMTQNWKPDDNSQGPVGSSPYSVKPDTYPSPKFKARLSSKPDNFGPVPALITLEFTETKYKY